MKKILIVDDSRSVRLAVRKEISHHDFVIKEASSGEESLEMLRSFKPDLITMDIEMEGLNGFETCSRIRRLPAPLNMIPVIFLTGHDSMENRFQGFESGATDFFSKHSQGDELLKTIQSILNPDERGKNITVLVADDTQSVQILVRHCLKGIAGRILTAENGREAFEIYKKERKSINCVITDFEMPEMKGDELCRLIRRESGSGTLPIIFLSAHGGTEEILNIYRAGGSDYIAKPFIREEFIARIKVHLNANTTAAALEEEVLNLRQVILSKNFHFKEEKKQLTKDLTELIENCSEVLTNKSEPSRILSDLKILHKKGKALLEKLNQNLFQD